MHLSLKHIPETLFLITEQETLVADVPNIAPMITGGMDQLVDEYAIDPAGPYHFFYFDFSGDRETPFQFQVGLPVDYKLPVPEPYTYKLSYAHVCLSATYRGPVVGIKDAWAEFFGAATAQGYQPVDGKELYHQFIAFDSEDNIMELQLAILSQRQEL